MRRARTAAAMVTRKGVAQRKPQLRRRLKRSSGISILPDGFAFWRLSWWYGVASGYGERVLQAFPVVDLDSSWYHTAHRFYPFHHRHDVDAFQILAHLDLQTFATIIID
jgi:hypothetical protein